MVVRETFLPFLLLPLLLVQNLRVALVSTLTRSSRFALIVEEDSTAPTTPQTPVGTVPEAHTLLLPLQLLHV
jgi:hypothetical protein